MTVLEEQRDDGCLHTCCCSECAFTYSGDGELVANFSSYKDMNKTRYQVPSIKKQRDDKSEL